MKPILYWTLQRRMFDDYVALGVTSERNSGSSFRSGRINGRYADGATTHTTTRDIHGRFDTEADALKMVEHVKAIRARYANLRKPLDEEISKLYADETRDIEELLA